MEVVNITKIRDGFFTGDGATASNLEVILTFKITHIINTSPTQVMNTFEKNKLVNKFSVALYGVL